MNKRLQPSNLPSSPSEADATWLADQLRASRLTVLCGETTPALTALLAQGVLPRLMRRVGDRAALSAPAQGVRLSPERRRPHGAQAEVAVFFDQWQEAPRQALLQCVQEALAVVPAAEGDGGSLARLADRLSVLSQRHGIRFVMVLDRFEECLAALPARADLHALRDEIFEAINRAGLPAQFLIALREDGPRLLETLRSHIDGFDAKRRPFPPSGESMVVGPWASSLPPAPEDAGPVRVVDAGTDAVYASIEAWLADLLRRGAAPEGVPAPAATDEPAPASTHHSAGPPPDGLADAEPPTAPQGVPLPRFDAPARRADAPTLDPPATAAMNAARQRSPVEPASAEPLERLAAEIAAYVEALAPPAADVESESHAKGPPAAVQPPERAAGLPDAEASPPLSSADPTGPVSIGSPAVAEPTGDTTQAPSSAGRRDRHPPKSAAKRSTKPVPATRPSAPRRPLKPSADAPARQVASAPRAAVGAGAEGVAPVLAGSGLEANAGTASATRRVSMPSPRLPASARQTARQPGSSRRAVALGSAAVLAMVVLVGLWLSPQRGERDERLAGALRAPPSGEAPATDALMALPAQPTAAGPGPAMTSDVVAVAGGLPTAAPPIAATPRIELRAAGPVATRMANELARAALGVGDATWSVELSRGWAEDLAALRDSGPRLAIARYDALQAAHAQAGVGPLQIVMPLFTEELAFVVRADSSLAYIHQIEGRRIDVGAAGGARALTVRKAYEGLFGQPLPAAQAQHAEEAQALSALQAGRVDVVAWVGDVPPSWRTDASPGVPSVATPGAPGLRLLRLDRDHPSSRRALRALLPVQSTVGIGAGGRDAAVPTLAVMAFLVAGAPAAADRSAVGRATAGAAAPADLGRVARAWCDQLPALQRAGHPKWREVQPDLQLDASWPYAPEAQQALRDCAARARGAIAPAPRPNAPPAGTAPPKAQSQRSTSAGPASVPTTRSPTQAAANGASGNATAAPSVIRSVARFPSLSRSLPPSHNPGAFS